MHYYLSSFLFSLYLDVGQIRKTTILQKILDEYLTAQANHFHINAIVLVADKGEVIYQKSYGFAYFDTNRILNDSFVFELASVSKQFNASAILLIKERGKLQLMDFLR